MRCALSSDRTYYVSPSGCNGNNGLTPDQAFQTIQFAYDFILGDIDFNNYTVTIQLQDGTYTSGLLANIAGVGQKGPAALVLKGNTANPSLTKIAATCNSVWAGGGVSSGSMISVFDVELSSSAGGALLCEGGSMIFGNINFGACANAQVAASHGAFVIQSGNSYKIVGSAGCHAQVGTGATLALHGATVNIPCGPYTFGVFAQAISGGQLFVNDMTWINGNSQIGPRFSASGGGCITALTGNLDYLPGNLPGKAIFGGYYDCFTIPDNIEVISAPGNTYITPKSRDFLIDATSGPINIILPATSAYNAGMKFGFSRVDTTANAVQIFKTDVGPVVYTLPASGYYTTRSYTGGWYRFG